jgi:outer membrane protein OmpA-like peptidoglycan-associated protein
MKKITTLALATLIFIGSIFTSCESVKNTNKTQRGAGIGAVAGGVLGAVLGNNLGKGGNGALGAVLGGVIGGVAGGAIGNKMDKQAEKIKTEIPSAKVERIEEGINITFDEANPDGSKAGVYFATNKYAINANSKLALDKLVKIFNEYPETDILIEGHTDDIGREAYNMTLSQKRAESVAYFLRRAGIASSRIITKYYGESQPKFDNSSIENRSLNRRVEFAVTANEQMKAEAKQEAAQN